MEQMTDQQSRHAADGPQAQPVGHGTQNGCFGCGDANAAGLQLRFYAGALPSSTATEHAETAASDDSMDVHCRLTLDRRFQGPPGYAHGGIIATLLDEAMSKANRRRGISAMTRHMSVEYLRPVPLDTDLLLEGSGRPEGGRKHRCAASLHDAHGRVLATATGLFVEVRPERLLHPNPDAAATVP